MKYLGIDYGSKRIGVAVSDEGGRVAFPLMVVAAGPMTLREIDALVKKNSAAAVVIGESRDLSGQPNPLQEAIEQFAGDLRALARVEVVFEPEFLTTAMAARQGRDKRGGGGGEKSDASAAALILQSYLDKKNR